MKRILPLLALLLMSATFVQAQTQNALRSVPVTLLDQDWENGWKDWTSFSTEGENTGWAIGESHGNHFVQCNAQDQGVYECWLISPSFSLNDLSDAKLSFKSASNTEGFNIGSDIVVSFSNDYYGQDPTMATWTDLPCTLAFGTDWSESGPISLDAFEGGRCRIAFRSIGTENNASGWKIDDIMLTANKPGESFSITVLQPEHGSLSASQTEAMTGDTICITAIPNPNYALSSLTVREATFLFPQSVELFNDYCFIMPAFDVVIRATFTKTDLPIIHGEMMKLEPICAGDPLQLVAPEVENADSGEWQISPNDSFDIYMTYTDQQLDASFDGWRLRYMAANEAGTAYSQKAIITVYPNVEESEIAQIVGKKCGTNIEHILVYPVAGLYYQWYYNNEPMANTAQYIHNENGLKAGTYRVEVSHFKDANGLRCSVSSDTYEVRLRSFVSSNPLKRDVPFFLENNGAGEGWLTVYSADGRKVHSQWLSEGQNAISLDLKSGLYVFSMTNSHGTTTEKVIIQ